MWHLDLGNAKITTTSLPGCAATIVYLCIALYQITTNGRLTAARLAVIGAIALTSVWSVVPEPYGTGWKLGPASCAALALTLLWLPAATATIYWLARKHVRNDERAIEL